MLVYRIEHHRLNRGPYYGDYYYKRLKKAYKVSRALNNAHNGSSHPCFQPYDINIPDTIKNAKGGDCIHQNHIRSGCDSLEQLKNWFRGFEKRLTNAGFVVRIYETEKVWYDYRKIQLLFNRRKAKLVEQIHI